jgi:membrane protein
MEGIKIKQLFSIVGRTFRNWWNSDPFRQSSVIAFYAIFSMPVLLVIIIDLAGIAFGQVAVRNQVITAITDSFGQDTALQIQDILIKTTQHKSSVIATVLGVITLVFGATGVFLELQNCLNNIWQVKPKPDQGFIYLIMSRLLSFGLLITIGFLMAISLIITALLTAFSRWIGVQFSIVAVYLLHSINILFSLTMITILFALMFKVLPETKISWRHLWPGAVLTSFLFILGKYALGYYFVQFQPASIYGAAGSIVLVLLWVSYSCIIVLFGAEFTRQFSYYKENLGT